VPKQINNSGIYILELFLPKRTILSHNKFKNQVFSIGYHYYIGSAQKYLLQRIERHRRKEKKLRWHIDYLLNNREVLISNIYTISNLPKNQECKLVDNLISEMQLKVVIKNFGNSDCKSCESHLLFSNTRLDYNHLCSLYQSAVIFIPSSNETS